MIDRLLAWLERGPTPLKIAAIAFAIGLPALATGFMIDDYAHMAAFSDLPRLNRIFKSPWHMFAFVSGEPEQTRAAIEHGLYPWWASDRIVLNFWRPVTVLTHWVDHLLWPRSAIMAHLQSLLWYAGLAGLAAALYRKIADPPEGRAGKATAAASLAGLLYAIDEAHALPMAWVANRNATLAAFWGVACLVLHVKWRREGRAWALGGALVALAASVHSNEGGIATTAYLFAYAVFLDRGATARRLATLIPYAALIVLWRMYYSLLGFGAKLSPTYIDPAAEPLRFVGALFERYPSLLMGQLTNFPSEAFFVLEGAAFAGLWIFCALVVLGLGAAWWTPAMRSREAGFWTLGMLLAAVPICATFPSNRLLLFVGLGGMGLVAQFISAVRKERGAFDAARRWLCTGLIALHLILSPVALLGTIGAFGVMAAKVRGTIEGVRFPEGVESKTVVIANAPNFFLTAYMTIARSLKGEPAPARLYMLSPNNPTSVPMTMTRVDERTLRVEPQGGFPWLLFRSEVEPFEVGDTVKLEAMTVEILETNHKGVPMTVEYRFDAPLEDERYVWMAIAGMQYRPFELPEIGETRHLNMDE